MNIEIECQSLLYQTWIANSVEDGADRTINVFFSGPKTASKTAFCSECVNNGGNSWRC